MSVSIYICLYTTYVYSYLCAPPTWSGQVSKLLEELFFIFFLEKGKSARRNSGLVGTSWEHYQEITGLVGKSRNLARSLLSHLDPQHVPQMIQDAPPVWGHALGHESLVGHLSGVHEGPIGNISGAHEVPRWKSFRSAWRPHWKYFWSPWRPRWKYFQTTWRPLWKSCWSAWVPRWKSLHGNLSGLLGALLGGPLVS